MTPTRLADRDVIGRGLIVGDDGDSAQPVQVKGYERCALEKRLSNIAVALGHPRLTAKQSAALVRERSEIECKLTSRASSHAVGRQR